MHDVLETALERLHIRAAVPSLEQASMVSITNLRAASDWLLDRVPIGDDNQVDVVVLGSYAREEASGASDFDYLVIPYGITPLRRTRELIKAVDDFISEELTLPGDPVRRPGTTGLFGTITGAADMGERIGLEHYTNLSHSRRVLLIEESVSIYAPDLHRQLLCSIFDRYLADYEDSVKTGPPRFLINDIIRYWYTLAVDYQAKRWER